MAGLVNHLVTDVVVQLGLGLVELLANDVLLVVPVVHLAVDLQALQTLSCSQGFVCTAQRMPPGHGHVWQLSM